MDKRRIPKNIKSQIKRYLEILKTEGIPYDQVILYGSYAKGSYHKDSDIDLCIVSYSFKDAWKSLNKLWAIRPEDARDIEPYPMTPETLNDRYSALAKEIRTTGIKVA